jgi:hypothetical protein
MAKKKGPIGPFRVQIDDESDLSFQFRQSREQVSH